MCGIAGYNVSKKWAEEWITPEIQEALLKEAWFHNIHRGRDAAGFFAFNMEGQLNIYKSPGQADELFGIDIAGKNILDISPVFGAHTRAPSHNSGDPKYNENNHPVDYKNCWAIHNGMIANDYTIRQMIVPNLKSRRKLPEVDSIAIPMVLHNVDITSTVAIIEALEMLAGSFATSIVWEEHPGINLLARGSTSPLVVAYHDAGGVFYGSEKESVWSLIHTMGIDPNHDFEWRTLDSGAYMLIENGHPIDWDVFKLTTTATAWAPYVMVRNLPAEEGRSREEVYRTTNNYDYINKVESFSLKDAVGKNDIVYARQLGFADEDTGYPIEKGELDWQAVIAEADLVVAHKDGDLYSVFVGDVEILMTGTRVVKDIFNHALFANKDRWSRIKNAAPDRIPAVSANYTFDEFFLKHKKTTSIHHIPTTPAEYYEYARPKGSGTGKVITYPQGQLPMRNTKSSSGTSDYTTDLKLRKPAHSIAWNPNPQQNVVSVQALTMHEQDNELMFLNNVECGIHKQLLSKHTKPRDCFVVLTAASFTCAAFSSIEQFYAIPGVEIVWERPSGYKPDDRCQDGHYWDTTSVLDILSDTTYWEVPIKQECVYCGTQLELATPPKWFESDLLRVKGPRDVDYIYDYLLSSGEVLTDDAI